MVSLSFVNFFRHTSNTAHPPLETTPAGHVSPLGAIAFHRWIEIQAVQQ